jgi:hypothetical protein
VRLRGARAIVRLLCPCEDVDGRSEVCNGEACGRDRPGPTEEGGKGGQRGTSEMEIEKDQCGMSEIKVDS